MDSGSSLLRDLLCRLSVAQESVYIYLTCRSSTGFSYIRELSPSPLIGQYVITEMKYFTHFIIFKHKNSINYDPLLNEHFTLSENKAKNKYIVCLVNRQKNPKET